jgi:hypothetical protein
MGDITASSDTGLEWRAGAVRGPAVAEGVEEEEEEEEKEGSDEVEGCGEGGME